MPLLYSETVIFSTGIVIKRGLCRGGIGGMEDMQKFPRVNTLPSGGLDERRDDAVGFGSPVGTVAEADLPHDHHLSQGLFGVIVRGRDTGDAQEGEEMIPVRTDEKCPQRLRRFEGERPLTDSLQFLDETLFDVRCSLPEDITGF